MPRSTLHWRWHDCSTSSLSCHESKQASLAQLLDSVKIFPQVLLNIKFKAGYDWKSDEALNKQIAKVESELKDVGRVLIRTSGTEPVLRVMVETKDADAAMKAAKRIANLVPTA